MSISTPRSSIDIGFSGGINGIRTFESFGVKSAKGPTLKYESEPGMGVPFAVLLAKSVKLSKFRFELKTLLIVSLTKVCPSLTKVCPKSLNVFPRLLGVKLDVTALAISGPVVGIGKDGVDVGSLITV